MAVDEILWVIVQALRLKIYWFKKHQPNRRAIRLTSQI